jgi:predicted glycosyltransferase
VSAAGYNSFHELLAAGMPTIFAVTMRPELDDQLARARFAQSLGRGIALSTDDLSALPSHVSNIMDGLGDRRALREVEPVFARNGARQAAKVIAEFAR